MDPAYLPLMIGVLVTGALVSLILALSGGKDESRADQRLESLVGGRNTASIKESGADLLLREAVRGMDRKNLLEKLTPASFNLSKTIEQADVNVKPGALVAVGLISGLMGGILAGWLVNIYVAPIVAGGLFFTPFLWLRWMRNARLTKFQSQLPEAMELVARALRAGHSLSAGMHVVAEEMGAPISREFGRVYEEQNLGITLEESLSSMCERVPNLDLKFFATSVAIQRQTGGDLAEILDRIGHVIRERFKILGQIKALTGEGRISGVVLIALPIGLFLLMLVMKPDYIEMLWKDTLGIYMSIGAIVGMIVGSWWIKKIIDIKV
jgi:tight adherence protein B